MSFPWKEFRCKGYNRLEQRLLKEATRTTPIYTIYIGHAQNVAGVQELWGKNNFCVHMPYSAVGVVSGIF